MFAVKGWAVPSAALKTQTNGETRTNGVGDESSTDRVDIETVAKSDASRKRKRKGSEALSQELLPTADLSALWQEHIERKPKDEASTSKSAKRGSKAQQAGAVEVSQHARNDEASSSREKDVISSKKNTPAKGIPVSSPLKTAADTAVVPSTQPETSREQKTRKERRAEKKQSQTSEQTASEPKLTPLQSTMQQKLISSRFRHLNESLYTKPSATSMELFESNPQFFKEYHDGFRRQVEAWPENPRDTFLHWIRTRGALDIDQSSGRSESRVLWKQRKQFQQQRRMQDFSAAVAIQDMLPRDLHNGHCTIADLGCGEGQLAKALITPPSKKGMALTKRLKLYVHSFDLASAAPHVTTCDVRALPMREDSVDVAIFCLALMGTNWLEFVEEAYRVLRWRGELWISEVGSRFTSTATSASTDKVVEHSVGKRRKTPKNNSKKRDNNAADYKLSDQMPATLDDEDIAAGASPSANVAAFVDVLRRRGFQLLGSPEVGDKAMFVRMRFLKCLPPSRGKCVASTKPPPTAGKGKLAFIDEKPRQEDISVEAEATVLKPCVYKLR